MNGAPGNEDRPVTRRQRRAYTASAENPVNGVWPENPYPPSTAGLHRCGTEPDEAQATLLRRLGLRLPRRLRRLDEVFQMK